MVFKQVVSGFSSLMFKGGVAKLGQQPFTGKVRDILKNGDHVESIFNNGKIVSTKCCGAERNFAKRWKNDSVYTYDANFKVNSNFDITGNLKGCKTIASQKGNLFTVKTPQGDLLKVYNRSGDRSIIMSFNANNPNIRVLENGKVIHTNTPRRTLDRDIVYDYQALDGRGAWSKDSSNALNTIYWGD